MSKTKIAWTDETSNPLKARRADGKLGWYCRKISSACLNCYASTMNERQGSNPGRHGTGHAFKLSEAQHLEPYLNQKELDRIRRARKPRKWFVCDMTDLALQVGQCTACGKWREGTCSCVGGATPVALWPESYVFRCFDAWNTAAGRGQTVQILTKRPAQLRRLLAGWQERRGLIRAPDGWWIGVSAGTQAEWDENVAELLRIPAAIRFASVEPQLEAINPLRFTCGACGKAFSEAENPKAVKVMCPHCEHCDEHAGPFHLHHLGRSWSARAGTDRYPADPQPGLHWIIQGGESSPGYRPFYLEWMYSMKAACEAAGVAWFPKQLGSNAWIGGGAPNAVARLWRTPHHRAGENPQDWPPDLRGCRAFPEVAGD